MEKISKIVYQLLIYIFIPTCLIAQSQDSLIIKKDTVVVRKQHIAEEIVYEELSLSGVSSFYIGPVFLPNFSLSSISDNGLYDLSHTPGFSFSTGIDYSLSLYSYFIKAGVGFLYIRENKRFDTNLPAIDTTYIGSDSYIITYNENVQDDLKSNYYYLNIPLSLGKEFSIGKFSLKPAIGFQFDFLLAATGYNGARLEEVYVINRNMLSPLRTNISLANAIAIPINKRLDIFVEPWFNYALSSEYNHNTNIPAFKRHSWGVKLGLSFK